MATFLRLFWLFLIYSFLGWVGEVTHNAVLRRRYQDRGVLSGPLCVIYGVAAVLITIALRDIADGWWFVFIGSALYATVVEWVGGHILERTTEARWWDYSDKPFNLDGYICLGASALWGGLGLVVIKWGNPLLMRLFDLTPAPVRDIALWALLAVFALDVAGTLLTMSGVHYHFPAADEVHNRLGNLTLRAGLWILERVEHRMVVNIPTVNLAHPKREKSDHFAAGAGFYKLVVLFVIGAFLGDIVETIFCRLTAGVWMSRSSVVWGPFSIVWGLAIALVTKLLYAYKDRSLAFLFAAGTLLGGAYEYLCSVFTEIVFGKVFWDYSAYPLNLGGRINLLYYFFWGFAAILWFKVAYPPLNRLIEKIPRRPGQLATWALAVFMAANMLVSSAALARYDARDKGQPAANSIEVWLDEHYNDDVMKHIYPKAKSADQVGTKVLAEGEV